MNSIKQTGAIAYVVCFFAMIGILYLYGFVDLEYRNLFRHNFPTLLVIAGSVAVGPAMIITLMIMDKQKEVTLSAEREAAYKERKLAESRAKSILASPGTLVIQMYGGYFLGFDAKGATFVVDRIERAKQFHTQAEADAVLAELNRFL